MIFLHEIKKKKIYGALFSGGYQDESENLEHHQDINIFWVLEKTRRTCSARYS